MRSVFFAILLSVSLFAEAQIGSFQAYKVTSAGGTVVVAATNVPNSIYVYSDGAVSLSNDYTINTNTVPPVGTRFRVYYNGQNINPNGHNFVLFGFTILPSQLGHNGYYDFTVAKTLAGVVGLNYSYAPNDFAEADVIDGATIQDGTLTFDKLEGPITRTEIDSTGRGRIWYGNSIDATSTLYAGGSGKILLGNGTDLTSVSVSGDASLSSTGVLVIDSVITDADIKTGANIQRQKIATGSANQVVINNASGYLSSEATLSASRGGTQLNTSASTGYATVSAGTWSVGAITDSKTFEVSFDTTAIGDVKVLFPFACTVTGFYAAVTKTIQAANNATITPKNNAGTTMTSGAVTITAGTTIGTGFTSTPSANNVFTAGQVMTLTTAKANAGGSVLLTVTYTRVN